MDIYTPDIIEYLRDDFTNIKLIKFNLSPEKNIIQDRSEEIIKIKQPLETFLKETSPKNRLLLLNGKAYSGKSTLICEILENFQSNK